MGRKSALKSEIAKLKKEKKTYQERKKKIAAVRDSGQRKVNHAIGEMNDMIGSCSAKTDAASDNYHIGELANTINRYKEGDSMSDSVMSQLFTQLAKEEVRCRIKIEKLEGEITKKENELRSLKDDD